MTMGSERSSSSTSKPLHNFTMPCELRWGNQRFLRCMKVNSNGAISAVERRPSSSLSAATAGVVSNDNAMRNHTSNSNDFVSIIGKRKEKEKLFKDPPLSPSDHHHQQRCGSDYKKPGFKFKLPPLPSKKQQPEGESSCGKYRSSDEEEKRGGGEDGDGIAAVREKLTFDLQTAADKMKDAIFREGLQTEDQDNQPSPSPSPAPAVAPTAAATVVSSETADASIRPWNLRTRRAACKEPTVNGFVSGSASGTGTASASKGLMVDMMKPNSSLLSPFRAENSKSPRLRNGVSTAATPSCDKKERVKFSVPLARREIEEDFLAFAGRKPSRRPPKRPKHVQKQLDTLFPGLWLKEIKADMYKVHETQ